MKQRWFSSNTGVTWPRSSFVGTDDINQCTLRGDLDPPDGTADVVTPVRTDARPATLEELENDVRDECNNYNVKWFCGAHPVCQQPRSEAAFDRAWKNIKEKHLLVGTTTQWGATMQALQQLLPDEFGLYDPSMFRGKKKVHQLSYTKPTPETQRRLEANNAADRRLYVAVRKLFQQRMKACGVLVDEENLIT